VNYFAGPEIWEAGREVQGELGGVLGLMLLRDWTLYRLYGRISGPYLRSWIRCAASIVCYVKMTSNRIDISLKRVAVVEFQRVELCVYLSAEGMKFEALHV
jgi:hypothetical protein